MTLRAVTLTTLAILLLQCATNLPTANAGGGGGGGRPPGGNGPLPCCAINRRTGECRQRRNCQCCPLAGIQSEISSTAPSYLKVAAFEVTKVTGVEATAASNVEACMSRAVITVKDLSVKTSAASVQGLARELTQTSSTPAGLTVYVTSDAKFVPSSDAEAVSSESAAMTQLYSDVAKAATGLAHVQGCAAGSSAEFGFVAQVKKIVNFNLPEGACAGLVGAVVTGRFSEASVAGAQKRVFVAAPDNSCI